ncbi:MAG: DUF4931 domain-containing protein [Microthrixaceae bacterium]
MTDSPIDHRTDPLTRAQSVVVPSRQKRPNLPNSGCPFCPGGLEAPEGTYDVKWFPNRWPAMPENRCEMVLYTPDHDRAFWQLSVSEARKVVDLWAERTRTLGERDDVAYVLVFENRGPDVGATIAHPHGQIYAYGEVPPQPLRELVDGVLEVPAAGDELIVASHGPWVGWVPRAATWPYELLLADAAGHGALCDEGLDRDGLALLLIDVLARLDQVAEGEMPYMMWVHQRPTNGEAFATQPVHVHIAPLLRSPGTPRFVAAAELGSHLYFNPVDPSAAAAELRDQPGPPDSPNRNGQSAEDHA